jgi:hypothetical protein
MSSARCAPTASTCQFMTFKLVFPNAARPGGPTLLRRNFDAHRALLDHGREALALPDRHAEGVARRVEWGGFGELAGSLLIGNFGNGQQSGDRREYLSVKEVELLVGTARSRGRYGRRDTTMILIAFRHGRSRDWHGAAVNLDHEETTGPVGTTLGLRSLGTGKSPCRSSVYRHFVPRLPWKPVCSLLDKTKI